MYAPDPIVAELEDESLTITLTAAEWLTVVDACSSNKPLQEKLFNAVIVELNKLDC